MILPGNKRETVGDLVSDRMGDVTLEDFKASILGRNIFSPPNSPPSIRFVGNKRVHLGDRLSVRVSADDPDDMEAVEEFLQEQQSPVGSLITTELNQDFIQLFSPDWAGALPASFFFDRDGNLVAQWQGKRSYDEYLNTIVRLLNP